MYQTNHWLAELSDTKGTTKSIRRKQNVNAMAEKISTDTQSQTTHNIRQANVEQHDPITTAGIPGATEE